MKERLPVRLGKCVIFMHKLIEDKIKRLLEYKMVALEPEDTMLISQLNMGYALKMAGDDAYYLEYQQELYKTEEELIQDTAFIHQTIDDNDAAQKFIEFMFEVKGYQLKSLYKKGYFNFQALVINHNNDIT